MRTPLAFALSALLLTACGGDGGGGASVPSTSPALGSVDLPGARVTVTRTAGDGTAGSSATFRITSADAGIATVEVLVGTAWHDASAATVSAPTAGTWDATLTLPTPLPAAAAVLVRLTMSDGSVLESGSDALRL